MSEQSGFKVTVAGQYYSGTGRDKVVKMYKGEVFYIPTVVDIAIGRKFVETTNAQGKKVKTSVPDKKRVSGKGAALHVIQRRLLRNRLASKYQDFAGFRTCQIVDVQPCTIPADQVIDTTKPISQMTLDELVSIVAMESLDTNPQMFADLDDARAAVAMELKRPFVQKPVSDEAPEGVLTASGAVSADDGVPTDEEDPAEGLM